MGLMTNYLMTTRNLEAFLNAIREARAPETFTTKFLKDLDFTSSNDRLFIGVLKGLGFLSEDAAPTERYFAFLDQSQSGVVLAEAIREAYEDLFAINKNAQNLDLEDVKGKFKTLTQGQKSENVIHLMATTFKSLAEQADWSSAAKVDDVPPDKVEESDTEGKSEAAEQLPPVTGLKEFGFQYNIQLILPSSSDPRVYDALFSSLRKHLL